MLNESNFIEQLTYKAGIIKEVNSAMKATIMFGSWLVSALNVMNDAK